ncbi:transcriptional-regulating factor 1-like [Toxotes jaculatrix]|uniref:transcriptional-regulating factor 1-like n=1 Tax=Toxotes jaculatrix TaxID=941984 RepID=UPI001B3AB813|nr:transcriptional-regulating factor 1-like [Toxotes jaculatrix]
MHDNMSDLWTFSSSSPPLIINHSALSQSPPFISSPPPLSSPSSFRNHGNPPHAKVTSPHLPQPQVTSSYLSHAQVTSPHHLPQPQVTSPHFPQPQTTSPHFPLPQTTSPHLPSTQVKSPHFVPEPQVSSPHLLPQAQITSPHHAPHSQVTPYIAQSQANLSYPLHQTHVTTSHHLPHSQITSPYALVPSQQHLSRLTPGLNNPQWNKSEHPSEPSCLLNSHSYSYQNQATAHLDLQNQNQFGTGVTQSGDELENMPFNTHPLHVSGMYGHGDTLVTGQDTWGPLEPTLAQMQCTPLGSLSGGIALGRWSSMEFSSSSTEDFSNAQSFPHTYHDGNATQAFCSPSTPGPSPHYPQTPTISSPGPQMHPRNERLGFHTQTSTQLNRDQPLSSCLHESDSYTLSSEPSQCRPHQTGQHLLPSQTEPIQDQTGLFNAASSLQTNYSPQGRGQNVSGAVQSPSLTTGLIWTEECGQGGRNTGKGGGGRGGGGRRGGRGGGQPDWTWMKRPQTENSSKVVDCRLLCTVCMRDFRSLPALNGHMRSHSGFRAATWLKKGGDSSAPAQSSGSMVMPVSVPVQSRGTSKACRSGQRTCSRLSPATGGSVLYRSLMHLEEEEAVTRCDASAAGGGDEDHEAVVRGDGVVDRGRGHYTPPPMLCPLRAGPGLYCSLATRRQQRVQTVQLHNTQNGLGDVATETLTTRLNKPRINVGRAFQAEIPSFCNHKYAHADSEKALPLWTPWAELEKPVSQQRVDALLTMARSSVVPGGGASPEYALHVLSECRGDFLLTVEKLLSTPEASNNHHTGVSWTAAEMRLLVKSLQLHHKDFSSVQRAVQTKSLSQCVEFYYLWKKKLSLSARTPAGLTVTLPNTNGQRSSRSHNAS